MKKNKKINSILLFLLLGAGGYVFAQQQVQFTQYMFNKLYYNPAYAGSKDALSFALTGRRQWVGMPGTPTLSTFSIQTPFRSKKVGVAVEVFGSETGPLKNQGFMLTYTYRIHLFNGTLGMGLRLGAQTYQYDFGAINFYDQADSYNTGQTITQLVPRSDFGLYFSNTTSYTGFSIHNLINSKTIGETSFTQSTSELAQHYYFMAGHGFQVSEKLVLNPSLLIKYTASAPMVFDIGTNLLIDNRLWLGLSYRSSYGITGLAQYNINNKFKIGYSYDAGFNKIGTNGGATHEILLQYDFNIFNSKVVSPKYL